MRHLRDVSLVVIDTAYHRLAERALLATLGRVSFDDVLVFSDRSLQVPVPTIPCAVNSLHEAEQFVWYGVLPHLKTRHALYIQRDGWVVNPDAWTDEFLQFDWIGACWPNEEQGVGNGGFSLRSRRLLQVLGDARPAFPFDHPEDSQLCRIHRPALESLGLRWADRETARKFSHEHEGPRGGFGFHGIWNCLYYLTEEECIDRLAMFKPEQFRNLQSAFLLRNARWLDKKRLLSVLDEKLREAA